MSNWNISTNRLYTVWLYGLLFLVAYLPGATGIAQPLPVKIKGKLTNAKGEPVVNATIQAFQKEQLIGWSISKTSGQFELSLSATTAFQLHISHINFEKKLVSYSSPFPEDRDLGIIQLTEQKVVLDTVIVAKKDPVKISGDTIIYKAKPYLSQETRVVEDLLRKLPGIQVSEDGRISFQNTEIKKILIDGADLAGNGYQLISKNLAAETVENIELIRNFSENRLLAAFEKSGEAGINLTLNKAYAESISGNLTVGASTDERYHYKGTVQAFGKKLKLISLAESNTVGNYLQGSIQAGFNTHYKEGSLSSPFLTSYQQQLLQPELITPPSLPLPYTYNNRDQQAMLTLHAKGKSNNGFRLTGGYFRNDYQLRRQGEDQYRLADGSGWTIESQEALHPGEKLAGLETSYVLDQNRSARTEIRAKAMVSNNSTGYRSILTGALTDTTIADYTNRIRFFEARLNHTKALGANRLFQQEVFMSSSPVRDQMKLRTARFNSLLGLTDGVNELISSTRQNRITAGSRSELKIRKNTSVWSTGVTTELESIRPDGFHSLHFFSMKGFAGSSYQLKKKQRIGFSIQPGFLLPTLQTSSKSLYFTPSLTIDYYKEINSSAGLGMQYSFERKRPDPIYFWGDSLVNSINSIHLEATSFQPVSSHELLFNFYSINFSSQLSSNGRVLIGYSPADYSWSSLQQPEFSFLQPALLSNHWKTMASYSLGLPLLALQSRIEYGFSFIFRNMPALLNQERIQYKMGSLEQYVSLQSGWNFPIQAATRLSFTLLSNQLKAANRPEQTNHIRLWNFQSTISTRLKKPVNAALQYQFNELGQNSRLHTLSAKISYRINSRFELQSRLHNLLNAGTIENRSSYKNVFNSIQQIQLVPRYIYLECMIRL
ncbi:TonB-dependent receptor [Flavihumibacter sp. RY-1]|uniref:TonB-dependent receptor n=1 Tax=Flavihumibacter fluminis TaxID=2909236 RepID=A0ABS9BP28_9BACT|nr:TonB-dependent receptor [Flavihumibacter fluminis]MCF1716868.1 TonB-dependent receptor [Flavihumibacter fluminis]